MSYQWCYKGSLLVQWAHSQLPSWHADMLLSLLIPFPPILCHLLHLLAFSITIYLSQSLFSRLTMMEFERKTSVPALLRVVPYHFLVYDISLLVPY